MTAVDDAKERYLRLHAIVSRFRDDALRQPLSRQNREFGVVNVNDKPGEARRKLSIAFDEMLQRIEYLAFLDVCASFENAFRGRVGTAIGEARRIVGERYELRVLAKLSVRLVREPKSFNSLAAIFEVLDGLIPADMASDLRLIREERNRLSHGIDFDQPLKLTIEDLCDKLNALTEEIW